MFFWIHILDTQNAKGTILQNVFCHLLLCLHTPYSACDRFRTEVPRAVIDTVCEVNLRHVEISLGTRHCDAMLVSICESLLKLMSFNEFGKFE